MTALAKRARRSSKGPALKPFYPIPLGGPEDPELTRLIGFSIARFQRTGWRWLVRHGFLKKDALGNLTTTPEPDRPEKNRPKGDVLGHMVDNLTSTTFMWGPERLAGRRWNGALIAARRSLVIFSEYAKARFVEDSDSAAHATGGEHGGVAILTAEIRDLTEGLIAKIATAQTKIIVYKDDRLPGLDGGRRPSNAFLANLEARLSVAGF